MKKIRLETKIKRILLGTLVPMVVLMLLLLAIVSRYISQYDRLLENLAISSDGVIVIKAQEYRSQELNREAALARLIPTSLKWWKTGPTHCWPMA